MDKIKALVEQALLSEDHLTLQDKPEDAQAVKFEAGGDTFEGWVAKNGEEFHVVMFKHSDKVDMYVEEKCACEDGAKSLIVQMIKTLQDTKEEPSDEDAEDTEDDKPSYPFAASDDGDGDGDEETDKGDKLEEAALTEFLDSLNPFKKSQAELYPENEFAQYGDGKVADDKQKVRAEIENHPLYKKLCSLEDAKDDAEGAQFHSLDKASLEVATQIGQDTGYSAFSVRRYAGWPQRFAREK